MSSLFVIWILVLALVSGCASPTKVVQSGNLGISDFGRARFVFFPMDSKSLDGTVRNKTATRAIVERFNSAGVNAVYGDDPWKHDKENKWFFAFVQVNAADKEQYVPGSTYVYSAPSYSNVQGTVTSNSGYGQSYRYSGTVQTTEQKSVTTSGYYKTVTCVAVQIKYQEFGKGRNPAAKLEKKFEQVLRRCDDSEGESMYRNIGTAAAENLGKEGQFSVSGT